MKVRWACAIRALLLFPREPALIPTPTATRNRAHHVQAWYDGPEQVRETPSRSGEAQRRVKVRRHDCVIQALPTPIPLFLGSTFHLVLFVCYISNQEGCELGGNEPPLGWHCVISPPVYRILEAFPVLLILMCVVRRRSPLAHRKMQCTVTVPFSNLRALPSDRLKCVFPWCVPDPVGRRFAPKSYHSS